MTDRRRREAIAKERETEQWEAMKEPENIRSMEYEIAELRSRLAGLEEAALAYIRADYLRTHPWTKVILCSALDHPDIYPEGQKPKHSEGGCPCGKRRTSP